MLQSVEKVINSPNPIAANHLPRNNILHDVFNIITIYVMSHLTQSFDKYSDLLPLATQNINFKVG